MTNPEFRVGGEFRMLSRMKKNSGASEHPLYKSWYAMHARCYDPRCHIYKSYGARGIAVCSSWNTFEIFCSDMGERPLGHTLDRINVNGDYEPSNCRWSSYKSQARNRRDSRPPILFRGSMMTPPQIADVTGVHQNNIYRWIDQGADVDSRVRRYLNRQLEVV